jgi:hypothetical protein
MRSRARLLAVGLALAGAGSARAQNAICDIPIVQALHDGDDGRAPVVDPQINRLRPYLLRQPFTSWREFKLLDRQELDIPLHDSRDFPLPNERKATLTFQEHSDGPGDHRLTLRLTINDPKKHGRMLDTTYVIDEGGVVLHVGQRYQGGILILGISCKTH